ncbi:MAG TPA: hypothetical protein VHG32_19415 [Thermoanaerobaculia bacterium]|jgi:hypothetical protein|nr:hypothetical protein [Thermoanaerobaculia bacterium]
MPATISGSTSPPDAASTSDHAAARVRRQGLTLATVWGEVEVAAGEDESGGDAGDDDQSPLGRRRDRHPIGAEHDEDEAGRLHQDGGQRDPETGAPGRHRSLRQARIPTAEPGSP